MESGEELSVLEIVLFSFSGLVVLFIVGWLFYKVVRLALRIMFADDGLETTGEFFDPIELAVEGLEVIGEVVEAEEKHNKTMSFSCVTENSDTQQPFFNELHDEVLKGNIGRVKVLISAGADLNLKNHAGKSPLDIAVSKADIAMARLLRSNGAR